MAYAESSCTLITYGLCTYIYVSVYVYMGIYSVPLHSVQANAFLFGDDYFLVNSFHFVIYYWFFHAGQHNLNH